MDLRDELHLLHDDAAVMRRDDRGHVLVRGPDAFSFLQALVSADLDPLADGDGAASLLLSPQGKLEAAFRLLRVGDEAWLDADPGVAAQLAASLLRFRIRVDADVVDRSDTWGMASLIGPAVPARFPSAVPDAVHAHAGIGGVRVVRTDDGVDLVGPRPAVDDAVAGLVAAGWQEVGPVASLAYRIERGIPVQPVDVDSSTIPQEAELEFDSVSFTKGCFLGQELVCRIDSRGHVNRFLRRLVPLDDTRPVPGAEVMAGEKVVGAVTSVTPEGVAPVALGYVRREVEPGAVVELRWDAGTTEARVEARRAGAG